MFHQNQILLQTAGPKTPSVPCSEQPPLPSGAMQHHIGVHQGLPCIAYAVDILPDLSGYTLVDLRASYDILGPALYELAGKGAELLYWDTQSRYCSFCGEKTVLAGPISKRCPRCGKEIFPGIATAILVLIRRGDTALLVRGHNFRGKNYGLVAGFLEPGESLEECVAREVMEETSLSIDDIRYFGSQPWPYPSGLMVGFIAEYRSGELKLQEEELAAAGFFDRDNLPELPHRLSLARRMIDWWRTL